MHRFLLHNDRVRDASEICLTPGQVGVLSGWGVFSTIRVSDGVLFAFERHWARMKRDAKLLRVPFPSDAGAVERLLLQLVEANRVTDATLRVAVIRNKGTMWEGPSIAREYDLIAFTTGVSQWGKSVRLGLVPQGRHAASRFAGTKMLSWSLNLVWYEEAHLNGFDEVVLLNERGEVSECTSANIFAAEGSRVWTPPLSSGCLPGITREILLGEIRVPGVEIGEKVLMPADLEKADQVFITSTTRALLPVEAIEGLTVRRDDGVHRKLQQAFSDYVEAYVAQHRPAPAAQR